MSPASSAVVVCKDLADFDARVRQPGVWTLVDFTAEWCGPCQRIGPVFAKLADTHTADTGLVFLQVDVDDAPEISARARVRAMPTFQLWHDGNIVEEFTGADSRRLNTLVQRAEEEVQTAAAHALPIVDEGLVHASAASARTSTSSR